MKIHILDDVHLEFGKWGRAVDIAGIDADVTVLAGDIGVGLAGLEWALGFTRPVVYVMGNHEFYGQRAMDVLWKKAREKVAGTHVHLLENQSIVIDGVRFLGATLWTDFALFGADQQAMVMKEVGRDMNDYAQILVSGHRGGMRWDPVAGQLSRRSGALMPKHVLELHRESRAYIERELSDNPGPAIQKTVVVTHHAPSALSLPARVPDLLDAAYCPASTTLSGRRQLS